LKKWNDNLMGKTSDMPWRQRLAFLDGLRGLAALYVMIGHSRWLLWEGYSEGFLKHPGEYSVFGKTMVYFLSLFTYGHEAVLFFFVLSGLVIHLKYSVKLRTDSTYKFEFFPYLKKRAKRIYPPLIYSILITTLLDAAGKHLGFSIYDQITPNKSINDVVLCNTGLKTLLGNLLLLQNAWVPTWGTNGPLWSLKFEWWFYMLYPLLFFINKRSTSGSLFFVIFLYFLGLILPESVFPLFVQVCTYLLSWWIGCVVADILTRRIRVETRYLSLLVLVFPFLLLFGHSIPSVIVVDTFWAVGFGGFLCLLLFLQDKNVSLHYLARLKWLGDCSYTLYVTHFPFFVFFNGIILANSNNIMPKHFLFVFLGIVFAVAFAWGSHFFVELPFVRSGPKNQKQGA